MHPFPLPRATAPDMLPPMARRGTALTVLGVHGLLAWAVLSFGPAARVVPAEPAAIEATIVLPEPVAPRGRVAPQAAPIAPATEPVRPRPVEPARPRTPPPIAAPPRPESVRTENTAQVPGEPRRETAASAPTAATAASVTPAREPAAGPAAPASEPVAAAAPVAAPATALAPAQVPAPAPAPASPRTLAIGAVTYLTPPVLDYPLAARRAREEGRVHVRVLVDAQGRPAQAEVVRTSGFARLDESALTTARATRFRPYTENGVALPFRVVMPLIFELEN